MKPKLPREIINITTKQTLAATSDCFKKNLQSLLAMMSFFSHSQTLSNEVFCKQGLSKFKLFQAEEKHFCAQPSLPRGCSASTQHEVLPEWHCHWGWQVSTLALWGGFSSDRASLGSAYRRVSSKHPERRIA